jgi:transcriptional regulator GlxA family with amidase domain
VVTLARHGVSQVVLHRFDDEPGRFRQLLARQPAEPLGDAVLAQLAPALGRLAPPLAQAVERLFRRPQHFFAAHDLAAAAGMTLRTVYRQLEAAGLASPRLLVVAARVLRGYAYMRDPGREIADVAASLGYSEPRIFTRHTYAAVGLQPRALRRRMEPDAFVRTLADRLLAGEERSPVGAHE